MSDLSMDDFNSALMACDQLRSEGLVLKRRVVWILNQLAMDLDLSGLPTAWEAACMPMRSRALLEEYRGGVSARWEARKLSRAIAVKAGPTSQEGRL